jgi:2-polyprenyl-3-methyl-5-hydroxy-6-metoxy-1,4-benzoquinol methylase
MKIDKLRQQHFADIEVSNILANQKPGTAASNGRLWGLRARDWAEVQEGQFMAAYEAVFARLKLSAAMRYCDVGCGSGMAALIASRLGAKVSALDAAENLIQFARDRVPAGDFRLGEMEQLPFADGEFDVVTGFNSFQYAADPVAALAQARRITKPVGRVVVMTWGSPERMEAASLVVALKPLLPPAPAGAPGPFALSDEAALSAFAASAGLKVLEIKEVACHWRYPNLETALRGLGSSGVAIRAIEHSGEAAVNQVHRAALAPFLGDDGAYRIGAAFKWMIAMP